MDKDRTVKVDKELLKKVEDFINKNKFLYTSKKQVVNLAVSEFLKKKKEIEEIHNKSARGQGVSGNI
jgi:metal-responsive CopG/Arc/MetJ family transcriptional regulator